MMMSILKRKSLLFIRNFSVQTRFAKEILCSAENREKCLKNIQSGTRPSFNMQKTTFAAVLIPMVYQVDTPHVSLLYTLRSNKLRKHIRQVSFPGEQFTN